MNTRDVCRRPVHLILRSKKCSVWIRIERYATWWLLAFIQRPGMNDPITSHSAQRFGGRTWAKIGRLFTERGFASRAVRARLIRLLRPPVLLLRWLKVDTPLRTEDRRVLEQIVFAHYGTDSRIKTVLFVGCDWYTAHYQQRYFAAHDYWTIDADATRRKYGSAQHVVARLEELDRHFPRRFFDLIICNGVYGYGLDRAEDCERAISQCHACLAHEGHLLFGWNDVPRRDPAPLSSVRGLSLFSPYSFPAFGTWQYVTDTAARHTYYFFQKR